MASILVSIIQMRLLQSIPSCPPMAVERVGYIFIIIPDPNYNFIPPETPPNAPNSKEVPPTSILVMFTCVYITPPYQNYPLHSLPSLSAPMASKYPIPPPLI